ncbi:helix-turn-helix transcriptional regulator [Dysgonomonas sp. GY75]|uniref:helix-turn-helix domain-containing protein n=1 Tax=Dysgonomonas sp. GY75 TaxID=2780419 RepID=UPI001883C77B|nr:helix-turn-helix transcriptional regulator [Dysgonomonas sp. GY75]MBF0651268.1 helix-turn-helix transcriptional regulator [Dysgonomonas sp. GY75]
MGLRVKEILKERGMTMIELSEKLGIVNDTLTRNLKNPQLKTLERISDALNVDVSELFESFSKDELTALINHRGKFYKASTLEELKKIIVDIEEKENKDVSKKEI